MRSYFLIVISFLQISTTYVFAGDPSSKKTGNDSSPVFTIYLQIPATPVKDQYNSNTCWSFSTVSLFESELLRTQHKEYDLSEMYIVRKTYDNKAERYLRMHGKINFAGGGEPNDVSDVMKYFGIMPEQSYTGLLPDSIHHVHTAMDLALKYYVDGLIKNDDKLNDKDWQKQFNKVMDGYMGKMPEDFTYEGKKYNAESFEKSLGIDPDNYVMLTSFIHYPFYSYSVLEIPDNWSWGKAYNLPMEDLLMVVDSSLYRGYSLTWSADVSEPGFNFDKGYALVPKIYYEPDSKEALKKYNRMSENEKENFLFNSLKPLEELNATAEIRQKAFDNYETTDDHAMHMVGEATDQNGKKYFFIKNSWGTDNPYKGYMFISEAYFKYKTILIMVNKNALPATIKAKLEQSPCNTGM
jgi:bleomycin hydrolase